MITSARQLKDKIRNLAKEKGADAQLLLRNYMMERFLERITNSAYRENFILKGGMLVTSMVGFEARSTMDMDATVQHATVSVDAMQKIMSEILSVNLADGVNFEIRSISDIMEEAEYPGMRFSITAFMDGVKVPLKVDISTGDAITPGAIEYPYRLMFEDRSICLLAYNLETVLAEKLDTIISRTTANTRMRDFYDIHILSALYWSEINQKTLAGALQATSDKRGHLDLLGNAEKVLSNLHDDKTMLSLWGNYRSKFSYAADISWNRVLRSVRNLAIAAGLQVKKPSLIEALHEPLPARKEQPVHHKNDMER